MPWIKLADPLDTRRNGLVILYYVTLYMYPHGPSIPVTSFLTCSRSYQTICLYGCPTLRPFDPDTPQDMHLFASSTKQFAAALYMVSCWSWYSVYMYYTSRTTYIEPHKPFQAILDKLTLCNIGRSAPITLSSTVSHKTHLTLITYKTYLAIVSVCTET